jgi:hypothetical protein
MNDDNPIENDNITKNAKKPKDTKKLRSLIAKYKNKSSDMSNNFSIESKLYKNLTTKGDNIDKVNESMYF